MWRPHAHEQRPSSCCGRTSAVQVGHQRLADLVRQRQPFVAVALASHGQLTGPPVDIVEFDSRDLTGP
jgi:hypothetical protein